MDESGGTEGGRECLIPGFTIVVRAISIYIAHPA